MTIKELLTKLLEHYKLAINHIQTEIHLEDLEVQHGICHCAEKIFRANIYHRKWVIDIAKELSGEETYWYTTPQNADDISHAKGLLQYRINAMQAILNGTFPAVDLELQIDLI